MLPRALLQPCKAQGNPGGTLPACSEFAVTGKRQLSSCLAEALGTAVSASAARGAAVCRPTGAFPRRRNEWAALPAVVSLAVPPLLLRSRHPKRRPGLGAGPPLRQCQSHLICHTRRRHALQPPRRRVQHLLRALRGQRHRADCVCGLRRQLHNGHSCEWHQGVQVVLPRVHCSGRRQRLTPPPVPTPAVLPPSSCTAGLARRGAHLRQPGGPGRPEAQQERLLCQRGRRAGPVLG